MNGLVMAIESSDFFYVAPCDITWKLHLVWNVSKAFLSAFCANLLTAMLNKYQICAGGFFSPCFLFSSPRHPQSSPAFLTVVRTLLLNGNTSIWKKRTGILTEDSRKQPSNFALSMGQKRGYNIIIITRCVRLFLCVCPSHHLVSGLFCQLVGLVRSAALWLKKNDYL